MSTRTDEANPDQIPGRDKGSTPVNLSEIGTVHNQGREKPHA